MTLHKNKKYLNKIYLQKLFKNLINNGNFKHLKIKLFKNKFYNSLNNYKLYLNKKLLMIQDNQDKIKYQNYFYKYFLNLK